MRYDQELKIKQAAEETRRRRRCVARVPRYIQTLSGLACVGAAEARLAPVPRTASTQLTSVHCAEQATRGGCAREGGRGAA